MFKNIFYCICFLFLSGSCLVASDSPFQCPTPYGVSLGSTGLYPVDATTPSAPPLIPVPEQTSTDPVVDIGELQGIMMATGESAKEAQSAFELLNRLWKRAVTKRNLALGSAFFRAYLILSCGCNRDSRALYSFTEAVDEILAYQIAVESRKNSCGGVVKPSEYLKYFPLLCVLEDVCSAFAKCFTCKRSSALDEYEDKYFEKYVDIDQDKSNKFVELLNCKIIPVFESLAVVARALANSDIVHKHSKSIKQQDDFFANKCTEGIAALRMLSKLIGSTDGHRNTKYNLAVAVVFMVCALHDYARDFFDKFIKLPVQNFAGNPQKFTGELVGKVISKKK